MGYTPVHQRTTNNVTITVNVRLTSGTYVVALFSGHKEPSGSEHPLASQNFTLTVG